MTSVITGVIRGRSHLELEISTLVSLFVNVRGSKPQHTSHWRTLESSTAEMVLMLRYTSNLYAILIFESGMKTSVCLFCTVDLYAVYSDPE